jgi:superfamily II RNA helicase
MAENVVTIGEVYVQLTGRRIGKLDPFYEHQVRAIDSEKRVIVLDAPTGSGKTLAALARVIAKKQSAIFAYPTNALVKNQEESIADLLRKIGRKPNIIGEDPKQDWATALDSTDIDLL